MKKLAHPVKSKNGPNRLTYKQHQQRLEQRYNAIRSGLVEKIDSEAEFGENWNSLKEDIKSSNKDREKGTDKMTITKWLECFLFHFVINMPIVAVNSRSIIFYFPNLMLGINRRGGQQAG